MTLISYGDLIYFPLYFIFYLFDIRRYRTTIEHLLSDDFHQFNLFMLTIH